MPDTSDGARGGDGPGDVRSARGAWGRRASALTGFVVGLMAASAAALVVYVALAYMRTGSTIDASRPTVVHQIRQLSRLETVMFGMDKIVSGGQETRFLPRFLAGDRLLLTAYGEVTAGVDLSKVRDSDVTVTGKAVVIRLPEPEIFSTRIDNARTRVYSRQTGLFTTVDPNLESDVRGEAERQIHKAALDGGILDAARANARTTLSALVGGLGFDTVDVR